jgi:hypothetical protein
MKENPMGVANIAQYLAIGAASNALNPSSFGEIPCPPTDFLASRLKPSLIWFV